METTTTHTAENTRTCKAGRELMGMPVVALENGEGLGRVQDVYYSPVEGRLVGFTILRKEGLLDSGELYGLQSDAIHTIGEDAVTVETARVLVHLTDDGRAMAGETGESVLGKRLMTDEGKLLGTVEDVRIDRLSRRVTAYEVSGGLWQDMMRGRTDVPVPHIISIGKDVVIVPEFVREQVEEPSGGLIAAAEEVRETVSEQVDAAREKVAELRTSAAESIEEREADYARGKVAGREVTDEAGGVIVREGEAITDAHIQRAIAAEKMHALALSAGRQAAAEATESARERASDAVAAVREKASDAAEAVRERQGDMLVGKTLGRSIVAETGDVLLPAGHVITPADVDSMQASGRLDQLTAAVGAATLESAGDRVTEAYDAAREQLAGAYDTAKAKMASAYDAARERVEEARSEPVSVTAATAPVIVTPAPVTVHAPAATVTAPPAASFEATSDRALDEPDTLDETPAHSAGTASPTR